MHRSLFPRRIAVSLAALALLPVSGVLAGVEAGQDVSGAGSPAGPVTAATPAAPVTAAALAAPVTAAAPAAPRSKSARTDRKKSLKMLDKRLEAEREEGEKREKSEARADEPEEAQAFYLRKRSPDGRSPISYDRYRRALEHMGRMPRYSSRLRRSFPAAPLEVLAPAGTSWSALGPGNIGGRTRSLVINPTQPSIMYAGSVGGGVWKSANGGSSWAPIADALANIAVGSIAMDPTNSSVLYVGTGEGYYSGDTIRGAGIFKTTDAGSSWTFLSATSSSDFFYVNDIVVSPRNPLRVYAATRTGVFRSLDGGSSWSSVLPVAVKGGCLDLVIRTDTATDTVLASCGTLDQGTVYLNTDAGGAGTWNAVLAEANMSRTSLAIAPSNQNVVYAMTTENDSSSQYYNGLHAIFRSTDSGKTWEARVRNTSSVKLNTVQMSNTIYAFYSECYKRRNSFLNQGWYDNVIAVDPVDSNVVWAGGVDLFRSDDGGSSWGMASHWWADKDSPSFAHADKHVLVFHPQYNGSSNQTLYLGSDGGLTRTDNARGPTLTGPQAPCDPDANQIDWISLNHGYAATQFYDGLPYPDNSAYFAGAQDNGSVRGTQAAGADAWTTLLGGDGGYVGIDYANPQVIYGEYYGLSLQKSTDGGATFSSSTNGISKDFGFLFTTPFTMDPLASKRLWIGGSFLWRTDDGAATWTRASKRIGMNGSVSAVAVSPRDSNLVFAGTSDGYVYWSDSALNATQLTPWLFKQPREGYVSWVTPDPLDPLTVYATYSTFDGGPHVWASNDGGTSWHGIDGVGNSALPNIPVHVLVVDPKNRSRLYVGTDVGVFVTSDGGGSWAVEYSGFPNVVTESMSTAGTTLYAFTHGRGAWRVPLY